MTSQENPKAGGGSTMRPWKLKLEIEHLQKLLDEEVRYRKQLELLLRQHNIDPILAHSIVLDILATATSSASRPQRGLSVHEIANSFPMVIDDVDKLVAEVEGTDNPEEFERVVHSVAKILKAPKGVEVRLQHVTWSVRTSNKKDTIPTVGSQLLDWMKKPFSLVTPKACSDPSITKNILSDLNAVLKPQQMTLLLGKPGSGKSSFLKLIAGDIAVDKQHTLSGTVLYNGQTPGPSTFDGKRVIAYVDQRDTHFANLTVEETITLAFQLQDDTELVTRSNPNDSTIALRKALSNRKVKVNRLLELFGLDHVRETLVGDELVRGVSGGQKKRVTLCERAVGFYRVFLGDQISTGLDSSTTFDIIKILKLATTAMDMTTVLSLLQPPPEVFQLFDQVLLMDEGQIVYLGPVESVLGHFQALGFDCPPHHDTADFLQEITTIEGERFWNESLAKEPRPVTPKDFATAFQNTELAQQIEHELSLPPPAPEWAPEQKVRFLQSWTTSTKLIVKRQFTLTNRNTKLLGAQIGQALIMGLLIGSLFYQLKIDQYSNRYGLFFLSSMNMALGAMPALPVMCKDREIFYRQRDASFYPTSSYVVAQAITSVPVNIVQTLLFGTLMWWMCGLTPQGNGSSWGLFIVLTLLLSLAVGQLLRVVAAVSPNTSMATPFAGFFIVLMILFSGFIIAEDNIPRYWIWAYWINPISWSIRAFAVLEFTSDKYSTPVAMTGSTIGELYLDAYGFRKESFWVWAAILYMIGLFLVNLVLTYFALEHLRQGGKPKAPEYGHVEGEVVGAGDSALERNFTAIQMEPVGMSAGTQGTDKDDSDKTAVKSVMPFTPVVLTFENIWYTVRVTSKQTNHSEKLDLLQGVSGFARPGSLTALMGSSGAGKTTLLDVISGRKTSGQIRGEIRVNGHKKDKSFARLSGYVEQMDIHSPHSTVLESLMFSARLRLPSSVASAVRIDFVMETMNLLELDSLSDKLVGIGSEGLTTEQRKRLTIGVELVANPSVLFLDEPTSGLDSRAAAIVMRVVRNIAATNRTIICTIHQPSAYLFDMFDTLLLLKKGGRTVYFGPLGEKSTNLIAYLRELPGSPEIKLNANPATYMLEVIGAGTSGANMLTVDAADAYQSSALRAANDSELLVLKTSNIPVFSFDDKYATSLTTQLKALIIKSFKSYWRSPTYNLTRMVVSIGVALVFGSVYKRSAVTTQSDVISRVAIIFIAAVFTAVVYLTSVIDTVTTERAVFTRERASNMYSSLPYSISFTLAEIPYIVGNTLVFAVVFYFTVGLHTEGYKFGYFWLYYMLMIANATFGGQMFATIASDSESATVMATLAMNIWAAFSGFMLSPGNIPNYWSFLYWLSPLHYLMEGLVVTQFHDDHKIVDVVTSTGRVSMTTEQYTKAYFGGEFTWSNRGADIVALAAFVVGFIVIRTIALAYFNTVKR